jgi:hypothetical protein
VTLKLIEGQIQTSEYGKVSQVLWDGSGDIVMGQVQSLQACQLLKRGWDRVMKRIE